MSKMMYIGYTLSQAGSDILHQKLLYAQILLNNLPQT